MCLQLVQFAVVWQPCSLAETNFCSLDQRPFTQLFFLSTTGTSEIVPVTESLIMQETRKLSTLKVSKGISV
jgi:hypothetical protein